MKTLALPFVALLFAVTLARADWVLVQKTNADGKEQAMTSKVKGDFARVDVGVQMSAILGPDGITMLMHEQKIMMKMDLTTMKNAVELAAKMTGAQAGGQPAVKPVASGQKEKVGEWETEIYTWEGQMGKGRFWVAKDFPHFAEINAVSEKLSKAMGNPMANLAPQAADFNGMVVKSEVVMLGKNVTTLMVSAKETEVDPKEFLPPEGYNEMKMPTMPGAAPQK